MNELIAIAVLVAVSAFLLYKLYREIVLRTKANDNSSTMLNLGIVEATRSESEIVEMAKLAADAARIRAQISLAANGQIDTQALFQAIEEVSGGRREPLVEAYLQWMVSIVNRESNGSLPTEQEEGVVSQLLDKYSLPSEQLPDQAWARFVRLCALRDLADGKIPDRAKIRGNLPFLLESGESPVWIFGDVEYLEDKVVRSSNRQYGGLSVRVAPGLYAHTGGSAPASVTEGYFSIDKGLLLATNRSIHFKGSHRAFRVAYKKIVALERFDYGFALCESHRTARFVGFEMPDPFPGFPYLLVHGLAQAGTASKP